MSERTDWLVGVLVQLIDPRTPDARIEEIVAGLDEKDLRSALTSVAVACSGFVEEGTSRAGRTHDWYLRQMRDAFTANIYEAPPTEGDAAK